MTTDPNSRVWAAIEEPVPRWQWAALRLLPAVRRLLLSRAEQALVVYAEQRGLTLVTAPIGFPRRLPGGVFLYAEAWAMAPPGNADSHDQPVPDVVDQEQCPRCRSTRVQLVWPAMTSWDCDGWWCQSCDHNWAGKVGG